MTYKILFAALLSQVACWLAMAAPMESVAHNARPTDLKAKSEQKAIQNSQGLHLSIRGGTALWAFQFVCTDTHCQFRHIRASRHVQQPEYIDLSVSLTCSAECMGRPNTPLQSASVSDGR